MGEFRQHIVFVFAFLIATSFVISPVIFSPKYSGAAEAKCEKKNPDYKSTRPGAKNPDKEFIEGSPCGGGLGKCIDQKCEIQGGGPKGDKKEGGKDMPPMLPMLPMLPMGGGMPMDMPMNPNDCGTGTGVRSAFSDSKTPTGSATPTPDGNGNPNCGSSGGTGSSDYFPSSGGTDTSGGNAAISNISDLFKDLFGGGSDFTDSGSGGTSSSTASSTQKATPFLGNPGIIEINPGVSGNIEFGPRGATVLIHRENGGTTVAGFYGADTSGAPQGLVQTWCATRPWATNFLSHIMPATFFDGLCMLRGFAVGLRPTAPNASHAPGVEIQHEPTSTSFSGQSYPTKPTRANARPAKVDIWSVPTSVRLGSRATVFWNATGVVSCEETSPEGSFTHSTLSGGAETVALAGPTTFVITCVSDSGEHVSNYVLVNLAN